MITSLISFLGGSVFRMIWGEVSAFITAKQEHAFEIERMRMQGDLEAAQHGRNLESLRVQAELGVKTIAVQAESYISQVEADGWLEAVKGSSKPVGIKWVDAWNAVIRPSVATWAIAVVTLSEFGVILLSDNAMAISGAALGIYLADRTLMKRGK